MCKRALSIITGLMFGLSFAPAYGMDSAVTGSAGSIHPINSQSQKIYVESKDAEVQSLPDATAEDSIEYSIDPNCHDKDKCDFDREHSVDPKVTKMSCPKGYMVTGLQYKTVTTRRRLEWPKQCKSKRFTDNVTPCDYSKNNIKYLESSAVRSVPKLSVTCSKISYPWESEPADNKK